MCSDLMLLLPNDSKIMYKVNKHSKNQNQNKRSLNNFVVISVTSIKYQVKSFFVRKCKACNYDVGLSHVD